LAQKSWPRRSVWRAILVSNVAERFGPVCGGVSAANQPWFAAQFAKVWRDKFRSGRRRKSTNLLLLSRCVSLGSGRDADGRRLRSHVVSACRRGVAQARGCPTARVSAESQRQFGCWWSSLVSHVAKLSGPTCRQVSAAKLFGRAEKFATAQRGKSRLASPKKRMVGPRSGGRGLSSAGSQTSAWRLRAGVVFYFRRLPKKFTTFWRFCHGVSFTTKFSTPFSVQRPCLRPCSGLTSALSGTGWPPAVKAARFGSGRCVRLRRLARAPARPWRRSLALFLTLGG